MSEELTLLALGVTVVIASAAQRITGLGFALVAAPVAIALLGAGDAISFVTLGGMVASAVALLGTWRMLRIRRVIALTVWAGLAIIPALFIASVLGEAFSAILAGTLTLVALWLAVHPSAIRVRGMLGSPVAAGILSGTMNALAGLGGPAAAAYGIVTGWKNDFVPNLQAFFLVTGPIVLLGRGLPSTVPVWFIAILVPTVIVGSLVGLLVSRVVSVRLATRGAALISVAGAIVAIATGAAALT